jgi:hypothetical protein
MPKIMYNSDSFWEVAMFETSQRHLCSPDIFQEKMSTLMQNLEFVKTYVDDLLVISARTFQDHVQKLVDSFKITF